jgi:hypothetical protein
MSKQAVVDYLFPWVKKERDILLQQLENQIQVSSVVKFVHEELDKKYAQLESEVLSLTLKAHVAEQKLADMIGAAKVPVTKVIKVGSASEIRKLVDAENAKIVAEQMKVEEGNG